MTLEATFEELEELSPGGYFVALRMGFVMPVLERKTFPHRWIETYTRRGFVLVDPAMHWMYQNRGSCRWSELGTPDNHGVQRQARLYGLNYGLAVSWADTCEAGQRSFGSFARPDREFEDHEILDIEQRMVALHSMVLPPDNLTQAELEALSFVKNGMLMKEIASLLGITEGAVKQRLKNAKMKLKAKNSTQAATMALSYGLI